MKSSYWVFFNIKTRGPGTECWGAAVVRDTGSWSNCVLTGERLAGAKIQRQWKLRRMPQPADYPLGAPLSLWTSPPLFRRVHVCLCGCLCLFVYALFSLRAVLTDMML